MRSEEARRRPPRSVGLPAQPRRELLRRGRELRHAGPGPRAATSPARELARESVAIEPEEAGFWKGLALAEYRAGDLDAALKAETKALELRNTRQRRGLRLRLAALALIHLERGDREQARWWAFLILSAGPRGLGVAEADFGRLAAENEARLRALLPADRRISVKLLERG